MNQKPSDFKGSLARLLGYALQGRKKFTALSVVTLISVACELAMPLAVEFCVNSITSLFGMKVDFANLAVGLAALGILIVLLLFLGWLHGLLLAEITVEMNRTLKADLFAKIMRADYGSVSRYRTGDLMSRVMNDVKLATDTFLDTLVDFLASVLVIIGCAVIMLVKCTELGFMIIAISLVSVFLVGTFSRFLFPAFTGQQIALGKLNAHVTESVNGIRTALAYNESGHNRKVMSGLSCDYYNRQLSAIRLQGAMEPLLLLLGNLSFLLCVVAGAVFMIQGTVTVGTMQAFLMYSKQYMDPVNTLGENFTGIQRSLAGAERIFEILDMEEESAGEKEKTDRGIEKEEEKRTDLGNEKEEGGRENDEEKRADLGNEKEEDGRENVEEKRTNRENEREEDREEIDIEKKTDRKIEKEEGIREARDFRNAIEFRGVTYGYRRNQPVLREFSMEIREGEQIALVGRTGAGKTTVTNLLFSLYGGYEGSILVEGRDIREVPLSWLRHRIALVPQDPGVMEGTIYENICYGCEVSGSASSEKMNSAAVAEAARAAGILGWIESLPMGFDTVIAAQGQNLSQGQLQMLGIARAILRGADILILDEATSSLDEETELRVKRQIATHLGGRTCITIAHRLSTIRDADRILVLAGGRIVEEGTFESLMKKKGSFYEMYQSQSDGKV